MTRLTLPYFIGLIFMHTAIFYGYDKQDYLWVPKSGAFIIMLAIWMTFKKFSSWNNLDVAGWESDKDIIWNSLRKDDFDSRYEEISEEKDENAKHFVLNHIDEILKVVKAA